MALSTQWRKKLGLASVFFTFSIDALSWSIVFPIFAPFFLDVSNHLFSPHVSLGWRTTILGLFIAAFSFGQFFGAPLLGEMADLKGRKKTLCVSVLLTLFGLAISAVGLQYQILSMLFVGRIITGVFAGNMSICLACITDLCPEEKERIRQFGKISVISGIAFVLGAFLGGKLSDASLSSLFFPALPLWVATGLTFCNALFVVLAFPETARKRQAQPFSIKIVFVHLKKTLQASRTQSMYGIYFLFLFAWTQVLQFVPVLMVREFNFTNSNLGDLALFMGVCWALGSSYINQILLWKFSSVRIMEGCLLCFTALCALIAWPSQIYYVLSIMAVCVIVGGIAFPHCSGMISNEAPPDMRGKFLGVSQALQALAMALAPSVGGIAYQAFSGFPFVLGAAASLVAAILYFKVYR